MNSNYTGNTFTGQRSGSSPQSQRPGMRHPQKPTGYPSQGSAFGYAPSVPLPVYRQLAAELQATRVMLDSLNAQNQQLVSQNQQLRVEIERVVQIALHLQQIADAYPVVGHSATVPDTSYVSVDISPEPMPATSPRPMHSAPSPRPVSSKPMFSDHPAWGSEFVAEQPLYATVDKPRRTDPSTGRRERDFSGLWLFLIIVGILVSAFGAGFVIARPFLNNQQQNHR